MSRGTGRVSTVDRAVIGVVKLCLNHNLGQNFYIFEALASENKVISLSLSFHYGLPNKCLDLFQDGCLAVRLASSRTLLWLQQTNMAEARRRMLRLQNVEPRNQWGHHVWLHHYLHLYLSDHFLEYLLLLSSFHALLSYLLLSFSFILLSCPESIFSSSSCLYFTNHFIHAAWLSLSLSCTHTCTQQKDTLPPVWTDSALPGSGGLHSADNTLSLWRLQPSLVSCCGRSMSLKNISVRTHEDLKTEPTMRWRIRWSMHSS